MEATSKKTILRIELWHVVMLLALLVPSLLGNSSNRRTTDRGPVHGHQLSSFELWRCLGANAFGWQRKSQGGCWVVGTQDRHLSGFVDHALLSGPIGCDILCVGLFDFDCSNSRRGRKNENEIGDIAMEHRFTWYNLLPDELQALLPSTPFLLSSRPC